MAREAQFAFVRRKIIAAAAFAGSVLVAMSSADAQPAAKPVCLYLNRDGDAVYSVLEPEKDWKLVGCGRANGQPGVWLNFKNADIRDVVRNLFQIMGERYVIDSRVHGQVTLRTDVDIPRDELPAVLLRMLRENCATMIRQKDTYSIMPIISMYTYSEPSVISEITEQSHGQPDRDPETIRKLGNIGYDSVTSAFRAISALPSVTVKDHGRLKTVDEPDGITYWLFQSFKDPAYSAAFKLIVTTGPDQLTQVQSSALCEGNGNYCEYSLAYWTKIYGQIAELTQARAAGCPKTTKELGFWIPPSLLPPDK